MDLVNIVYRYVNRFINSEELLALLKAIDESSFSAEEIVEIDKLLDEVENIIKKQFLLSLNFETLNFNNFLMYNI